MTDGPPAAAGLPAAPADTGEEPENAMLSSFDVAISSRLIKFSSCCSICVCDGEPRRRFGTGLCLAGCRLDARGKPICRAIAAFTGAVHAVFCNRTAFMRMRPPRDVARVVADTRQRPTRGVALLLPSRTRRTARTCAALFPPASHAAQREPIGGECVPCKQSTLP